ncbi:transcriptional regulator GcvA [Acinetobacter baumannii]|uniref:transcriptional regulator GcvA n=1 Tax=Acinetobacter baumannii TaxID=470 RepID=UPI0023425028|nr:transcriptional regulator GcvA [Acinetobacter baumannii]MDC4414440.1 transcriptional regulator GcvA [Acinetobacter baumannii]MDH2520317.1 transcriptional regulator GcvA [Acinetobacter baumannii]MDK2200808.1 transcriptional regulator GcvA [Acinetobacter baumannii]
MKTSYPSLTGLKTFEAVARHLSFTKAAYELNVTQTAVSHQIQRLENELGLLLFIRHKSGLILTAEGEAYLPGIALAFKEIRNSTKLLLERCDTTLTISTTVTMASKWLVPRLSSFKKAYPNIDVRIKASTDLVDFKKGEIDVAIRYGMGNWGGVRSDWLMADKIFPVCSPKLLNTNNRLKYPKDLANHTLLQLSGYTSDDWGRWLSAADLPIELASGSRLTFDLAMMAAQAAIDGLGVCIGRTTYVEDDLREGRLIAPFDLFLEDELGFYLVTPNEIENCMKVRAFRDWIISELQIHPR